MACIWSERGILSLSILFVLKFKTWASEVPIKFELGEVPELPVVCQLLVAFNTLELIITFHVPSINWKKPLPVKAGIVVPAKFKPSSSVLKIVRYCPSWGDVTLTLLVLTAKLFVIITEDRFAGMVILGAAEIFVVCKLKAPLQLN